ncbi:C39 family peptidase [Candidatus Shapirobacteria bacterium]|nr:C39 family peptidase [Candidatus Shapirobacteria bacterium]
MKNIALLLITTLFLSSCTQKISPHIEKAKSLIENVTETIAPVPTIILESGLPNKHLIKTSFIPQAPEKNWHQPWQDACEEASLLTLKYYYSGKTPDVATMVADYQLLFSFESDNKFKHDINIDNMSTISSQYLGLTPNILENPTIKDIKKELSLDHPVIITANGKTLYKENKNFRSGGPWYHSLVVLGYDDNSQKFIVHDVGTQHGAYFKYSYNLLLDSVHDFPVSGKKEEIDTGAKRILVLLK